MNQNERQLLKLLQAEFPLCVRPYQRLARKLGIREDAVRRRIAGLKRKEYIRRIGGVLASRHVRYCTTLVAAKVLPRYLNRVAGRISKREEVTHNYERPAAYNLWFTLHAPSQKRLKALVAEIRRDPDISELITLPTEKVFKIDARFAL